VALLLLASVPVNAQVVGFGKSATGGLDKMTCLVKDSIDECFTSGRASNLNIIFSKSVVQGPPGFRYVGSNVTIDGCANGQNGVTINQSADGKRGVIIEGPASNVIVKCLRNQGNEGGKKSGFATEFDLLAIDGGSGLVSNVLIDRVTVVGSTDGALDITGDVSDVTIQHSLLYGTPLGQLIKYDPRKRITLAYNIYTANGERNPQIKGDAQTIDFVSNIVVANTISRDGVGNAFDPYGLRIYAGASGSDSPGKPSVNVIGSYFSGPKAIELLDGPDVWLSGNTCVGSACPASTRSSPVPIPAEFATPAIPFADVVVQAGSPNHTARDTEVLASVAALVGGTPPPPPPPPPPTCPTCPVGQECTDPAVGCVPVPTDPCPECPVCPVCPPAKAPADFSYTSTCTNPRVTRTTFADRTVHLVVDRGTCSIDVK
jgi:hypothetical protein